MKKFRFLTGTYNKLLILAPHREETGTGKIARRIAKRLGCPAIINERIKRKDCNVNRRKDSFKQPDYIDALKSWAEIKRDKKPLVIWLHGHKHKPMCIFGYGQPDELIADEKTVRAIMFELSECGVECVDAGENFEQFAARHENNMAQFFKREGFEVNSVQLELSKQVRGMFADDFGEALSSSIKSIFEYVDEKSLSSPELVEKAASRVIEICAKHLFEAVLEVGQYFVNTLYEGDYERARNPRNSKGVVSFNKVCERVEAQGGPSKRWLYNALKLAVNEYDYGRMATYAKLSLSKKVELFRLDNRPEEKKAMIDRAALEAMTIEQLRGELKTFQYYEPSLEAQEYLLVKNIKNLFKTIQQKLKELKEVRRKMGK